LLLKHQDDSSDGDIAARVTDLLAAKGTESLYKWFVSSHGLGAEDSPNFVVSLISTPAD